MFLAAKRFFDIAVSLMLLPLLVSFALLLLCLNPFANRGRLFFVQDRMGRDCVAFKAIKFRSMRAAPQLGQGRGAESPLERDRITPLGQIIRKARIDELPQILNVLKGDMSLIGPRPDFLGHAVAFLDTVPGYRERHAVRPGISGLAQTEVGYVEGAAATRRKVHADLYYIAHQGFRLETWIVLRTLRVILLRAGS